MGHLRGLAERVTDAEEAFTRGAALFDEKRFFEAYVHFALAWKQTRAAGYRAVAQVAAGLCHLQRGNMAGARTVLERARAALVVDVPAEVVGPALRAAVDEVLRCLAADREPRYPVLPRRGAEGRR